MSQWTQEEAIKLCKLIETFAPKHGGHVALTGGLLYKEGPRKDCDVLLYRIRQRETPIDFDGLFAELSLFNVTKTADFGWVKKGQWNGKVFDMFDPDAVFDNEHCSG